MHSRRAFCGGRLKIGWFALFLLLAGTAGATPSANRAAKGKAIAGRALHHDGTRPLRDMPVIPPQRREQEESDDLHQRKIVSRNSQKVPDPLLQPAAPLNAIPGTTVNFEGIGNLSNVLPPDTNGDIGPHHYVQIVNNSFAIFDRSGNTLYGPAAISTLWSGFGGVCESHDDGDPIALYDPLADRWLISQFALFTPDGFHQCIAVSQTGDPTGAWYRYDFLLSATTINDYPHFGVWPDGYYMTINEFGNSGFLGAGALAFERNEMLSGHDAQMVYVDVSQIDPNFSGMLPSDVDGLVAPPPGSPNYFMEVDDDAFGFSTDRLQVFQFHVDWHDPSNSTFTGPAVIDLTAAGAAFDSQVCASGDCITQPANAPHLESLSDRLMYRLAYRNFGDHESLVVNHTVNADGQGHAGIRWYEIRNPGGNPPTLYQAGTYAPDTNHRWMGSIAMDGNGDMALGYSISSSSIFPSIRYTGRLASDPPGVMTLGEGTIVNGAGTQTLSSHPRWGDYSMMAVDPIDDCTFWYTQEYMPSTSSIGWHTRVGSFTFPTCVPQSAGALQGTVTDVSTGNPLPGVKIELAGATRITDQNGAYSFGLLPVGSGSAAASAFGYYPQSAGVTINNLGTTVQDFSLTPRPSVTLQGTVTDAGHGWPLYARVDIHGLPQSPLFTDPLTGSYSASVPQDEPLSMIVTPVAQGYRPTTRGITPPSGGDTEDFALVQDSSICVAPGYARTFSTFSISQPIYSFDFEASDGGFTAQGQSSWQWGVPTSGPGVAHSGTKIWATNLAGNYNDNESGWLQSPPLDLSGHPNDTLVLSWWDFLQSEQGYDSAYVEISHDSGNTWRAVFGPASGTVDGNWVQHQVLLDHSDAVAGLLVRFRLASDESVEAPGFYLDDVLVSTAQLQPVSTVLYEPFESGVLPVRWTVLDNAGSGQTWRFDNPGGRTNTTGGEGRFAIVDSDYFGPFGLQDTSLITPAVDVSGLAKVTLEYDSDFTSYDFYDEADVDVSVDGGITWNNIWNRAGFDEPGPVHDSFDITAIAAGHTTVQARFHYTGVWEWWWEVDNIRIGEPSQVRACAQLPGGVLVGHVTDATNSTPLNPASVTSNDAPQDVAATFNVPNDSAVGDGFYILFSTLTGQHSFTAAADTYVAAVNTVQVQAEGVVQEDFALTPAPKFPVNVTVIGTGTGAGTVNSIPSGLICPTACSASFFEGAQVTLSATPATGSAFMSWSGACGGTSPVCTLSIGNAPINVTATFEGLPNFSFPSAPPPQTIVAGQTANFPLALSSQNGFSGTVSFACVSGLPSLATCSFSPTSVTLPPDAGSTTLSIHTTAPSTLAATDPLFPVSPAWFGLVLPVAVIALGSGTRRRNRTTIAGLLLLLSWAVLVGCGGGAAGVTPSSGSSHPGTPRGTYNVTVRASSGNIVNTEIVTLVVQ